MSKTLGPIHYIMYEKIKFQDKLTVFLLDYSQLQILDKAIPPVPTDDLADIIDQENIHGFLSSKIDTVESRLAFAIAYGKNVYEKAYQLGKEVAPEELSENEEIFHSINTILLDGMPCDGALNAGTDKNGNLILITNIDTHQKYADSPLSIDPRDSLSVTCEGNHDHDDHENFHIKENLKLNLEDEDVPTYYLVREALLKGFLGKSHHEVQRHGKNFVIS